MDSGFFAQCSSSQEAASVVVLVTLKVREKVILVRGKIREFYLSKFVGSLYVCIVHDYVVAVLTLTVPVTTIDALQHFETG